MSDGVILLKHGCQLSPFAKASQDKSLAWRGGEYAANGLLCHPVACRGLA